MSDATEPAVDDLPWLARPPAERRLAVDDVVRACAGLPEAGRNVLSHDVETRPAGLLVPVADIGGEAHVVVTKRAAQLVHSNDWVFPGGGLDPRNDRSTAETARREASEELGVAPDAITMIGQLATWGPIVSGYLIDVYVGVLAAGTVLVPADAEVAEALALPLSWFTAEGAFEKRMMLSGYNPDPLDATFEPSLIGPFSAFAIRPDEWLWGLQADVLHELLVHLYA